MVRPTSASIKLLSQSSDIITNYQHLEPTETADNCDETFWTCLTVFWIIGWITNIEPYKHSEAGWKGDQSFFAQWIVSWVSTYATYV
jgi:hypothetical protein